MTTITIPALPSPLTGERSGAGSVHEIEPGTVILTAGAGHDLFADPSTDGLVNSVSLFALDAVGDFQFRAKVGVRFQEKFDSGVLIGYFTEKKWFKICAEMDPLGGRRVVTVVTNGRSDDANSTHLVGDDVHLRITRTGTTFSLHASHDGVLWDMIRYFTLGTANDAKLRVGIAAQSPAGRGTTATFSEFGWKAVGLADARDGS